MDFNERINQILAIKNGTFANIKYRTDCTKKVSAKCKTEVASVVKHTNRNCIIGVDYDNVARVKTLKESGAIGNIDCEYNWEWLDNLKEKVAFNTKTKSTCLRIFDINNDKCKYETSYQITFANGKSKVVKKEELRPYMQNSFFTAPKLTARPLLNWIKIENIEEINGK